MLELFGKTIDYLSQQIPNFECDKYKGQVKLFTCPKCHKKCCEFIPHTIYVMSCHTCGKIGDFFDVVKMLEKDKINFSNEEILQLYCAEYDIDVPINFKLEMYLDFYYNNSFDLVKITRNDKKPFEKDWINKPYKNREDWKKWIDLGLNIGVKTGKVSNITVIDIDQKVIPAEIEKIKGHCLMQSTPRGWHLFYKYDEDLVTTRLDDIKVDVLNNGKQCLLYPSIVDGKRRNFVNELKLIPIPDKLKTFLKTKSGSKSATTDFNNSELKMSTIPENLGLIGEGNRHHTLMHLGGILRKELSIQQSSFVLGLLNSYFCDPRMTQRELTAIIHSLDKYINVDAKEFARRILEYLRMVQEANAKDVQEYFKESKEKVDNALSYLVKEEYIIKFRRYYKIVNRVIWQDEFPNIDNNIDFKIPYFDDVAHFQWGDLILLGSQNKYGKTTIAMNIVHDLVGQGIKPYYITLEPGSRFQKTAIWLGMKPGDFYWSFVADPTLIELEKNSIIIIDWLMIKDKTQTDSIMKHFIEQLNKSNSLLIVFQQLKKDDSWFAPNMITQFPAFAARYIYEKDSDGSAGNWVIEAIREPKIRSKKAIIPCRYDWDTKKLVPVQDLPTQPDKVE